MTSTETLFRQAIERIGQRNWPAAESLLRQLTQTEGPLIPQVGYNLALVLRQRGGGPEVIDWLRRVLVEAPDYHNARFELAVELMNSGAYEQAYREFAGYLKACPADRDAMKNLALLSVRLGHWAEAEERLEAGLSNAKEDPELLLALANLRRETGGQDEADRLYRLLMAKHPDMRASLLTAMTTGSKGRLPRRLSSLLEADS